MDSRLVCTLSITVFLKIPFLINFFYSYIVRWLFPFIGHMGIAMSSGVIRDFAGPYYVSVSDIFVICALSLEHTLQ